MDEKFLDDRICEQLGGQLGYPLLAGRLAELDLEPLALPHPGNLPEPQSSAGTGDGLTLGVMDLGLQHDVDDYLGHTGRVDERVCSPELAT